MSFFLLGKGPDDQLRLLSTTAAATRKEALAELSKLTSQPTFSDWDAEVYVLNIEQGTPVLLVRPAEASAPVESEVTREPMSVTEETESIVTREDLEEPAAPVATVAEEPSGPKETAEEAVEARATFDEPGAEIEDEALAAVFEDLSSEEPESAAAIVTSEWPPALPLTEPVDEAWAEAVLDTETEAGAEAGAEEAMGAEAASEESSLREAIARTAAHMESTGIITPPSVGPEPVEEPSSVGSPGEEGGAAEPEVAWPWATTDDRAEAASFAIDALEEPGNDEGSLVRAPGDDETMSAARPVILGSYEHSVPTDIPAAESASELELPVAEEPHLLAAESPEHVTELPSAEEVTEVERAESDFLLDLEQIVEAPAEQPAGYQAVETDVREMSCDECVYVQTCPNKDQRDPASCGSFQWK